MKIKVMRKPTKPEKLIIERQSADYEFNFVSKKVAWEHFQEWAQNAIPKGATNVILELRENWLYDDCYTSLELSWDLLVLNSRYEKELKKYKKAMIKWKKS